MWLCQAIPKILSCFATCVRPPNKKKNKRFQQWRVETFFRRFRPCFSFHTPIIQNVSGLFQPRNTTPNKNQSRFQESLRMGRPRDQTDIGINQELSKGLSIVKIVALILRQVHKSQKSKKARDESDKCKAAFSFIKWWMSLAQRRRLKFITL